VLWDELLNQESDDVVFDFSRSRYLKQNAVVMLGGIARAIEQRGRKFSFDWKSCQPAVLRNLDRNQFKSSFDDSYSDSIGNTIPYRHNIEKDKNALIPYLLDYWLGRGWVNVSEALANAITGVLWEIYENAFTHGHSGIGVFTCGQRFPRTKKLSLSVVDFGIGIPESVQRFFQRRLRTPSDMNDLGNTLRILSNQSAALEWAFIRGTSTKNLETGGLGLHTLKSFIQKNHGSMRLFSNRAYLVLDEQGERYSSQKTRFDGTFINITLNCDADRYRYFLQSEAI